MSFIKQTGKTDGLYFTKEKNDEIWVRDIGVAGILWVFQNFCFEISHYFFCLKIRWFDIKKNIGSAEIDIITKNISDF